MSSTYQDGHLAELRAAQWLLSQGYHIKETNFRVRVGEIDIVAWDTKSQEFVFVEVKARHQDYSGQPVEAVSYQKWQRWVRAALIYLQRRQVTDDYRFDIISVWKEHLEHFPNVSWWY